MTKVNDPNATTSPARRAVEYTKLTNAHSASLGLPPVTSERAKQLGLELKGEHSDRFLEPGENHVPTEHWNAVKDRSPVSNWLEEGLLYEGDDKTAKAAPAGASAKKALTGLSDAEALQYVEASTDKEQLQQWLGNERRPEVRSAIGRRFETLSQAK